MAGQNSKFSAFFVTASTRFEELAIVLTLYLYSIFRKRFPVFVLPVVEQFERTVALLYSTVREWVCRNGKTLLPAVDEKVTALWNWVSNRFLIRKARESLHVISETYKAYASHVAQIWRDHGIFLGTIVIVVAVFIAFREWVGEVIKGPPIQSFADMAEQTSVYTTITTRFRATLLLFVAKVARHAQKMARQTRQVAEEWIELAKDSLNTRIDFIVATVTYARFIGCLRSAAEEIKSSDLYMRLETSVRPYVEPALSKISQTEIVKHIVYRLTPIKEE